MSVTPSKGQFRQVADLIRQGIEQGDYPRGTALPSEERLAEQFGVSRPVINRAVTILRADGLVRVERGRGTFVNEIPKIQRNAVNRQRRDVREEGQARGAFEAELKRLGLTAQSTVTIDQVPAPALVAGLLGIAEGETVLVRARQMSANEVPVQLASSYLPLDIAEGTPLAQKDTGPGGAYSRLADLGHAPTLFTEDIDVRAPSAEEARSLRLDEDQRIYEIIRTAETAAGRVVEVNVIVLPVHQWRLRYTWTAEG